MAGRLGDTLSIGQGDVELRQFVGTLGHSLFSTTDLSTGQRKRLALVNAWLEERPVLVFDEWAADQAGVPGRGQIGRAHV